MLVPKRPRLPLTSKLGKKQTKQNKNKTQIKKQTKPKSPTKLKQRVT